MDCLLYQDGTVLCVLPIKYVIKCNADFTYWPYDKQKCEIKFGSWSHTGEEISLDVNDKGVYKLFEIFTHKIAYIKLFLL